MLGFVLKRLAFTLFSIPVIIWIMLALVRLSPIDQVEQLIDANDFTTDQLAFSNIYEKTVRKNNMNVAPFYFSLQRSNYSKEFYSIANPIKKRFFLTLLQDNYDYKAIESFYSSLSESRLFTSNINLLNSTKKSATKLINEWESTLTQHPDLLKKIVAVKNSKNNKKALIPKLLFHGKNNAFHNTFTDFISLNWGNSLNDGKSATKKIFSALPITLFMLLISVLGSVFIGIILGIWFHNSPSRLTSLIEQFLYILKSIPLFVFALFMLNTFTTSEISPFLKIFPSVNAYGWSSSSGFWSNIGRNFNQLILPIMCIICLSVAYIARLVKQALNRENAAIYNKTALMKGMDKSQVFKHKLKNIRGILVTLISNKIIAGLAGSVIIEYIFNIPGMGRLLLDSIRENDIAVLMPIVLIIFIFSSLVMLTSDLLYQRYNPQISLSNG